MRPLWPRLKFRVKLGADKERGGLQVSLRSVEKGIDLTQIAGLFGGGGHDLAAAFELPGSSVTKDLPTVLQKVNTFLSKTS